MPGLLQVPKHVSLNVETVILEDTTRDVQGHRASCERPGNQIKGLLLPKPDSLSLAIFTYTLLEKLIKIM